MSLDAMVWVLRHSEATLGSRLVLIALADYAHGDGTNAFPSVEKLALHCRMTRRAVQAALRKLEEEGHIEQAGRRPSGTIVYTIRGVGTSPPSGPRTFSSEAETEPDGGVESSPGVVDDTRGVVHDRGGVVHAPDMSSTTPDPSEQSGEQLELNDPPLAPPEDGGGGSEESAQQRFMQSFREPREGWERTANGRGRRQRASRRGGKPVPVPAAPAPDPEPVASLNGDAGAAQAEWQRVLDVMRQSVDAPVAAIWLDPLTLAGRGQDGALVLTGDPGQVGWAIERFGRLLDAAAESVGVKVRIARHGATVSEVRPPGAG